MKLYVTGGDGYGWALDEDLKFFRSALPDFIQVTNLAEAEVVYSPWFEGLLAIGIENLQFKKIICGLDNPYLHWMSRPRFRCVSQLSILWIVHSQRSLDQIKSLGLNGFLIPYAVDLKIFNNNSNLLAKSNYRKSLGISDESYLISNFQRDTEGYDLTLPKLQKGPDVFVSIVTMLNDIVPNTHVLLAGPRRHWMRAELHRRNIPFTYIGNIYDGDDLRQNILPRSELAQLYNISDLYLLASRWEGGPYAILEAVACRCPILSTDVGIARDILDSSSIFSDIVEGADKATSYYRNQEISQVTDKYFHIIQEKFIKKQLVKILPDLFNLVDSLEPLVINKDSRLSIPKAIPNIFYRTYKKAVNKLTPKKAKNKRIIVSFLREYVKPPYGGGNQFMLALKNEMEFQGIDVRVNEINENIDGYIIDSIWFNQKLLNKLQFYNNKKIIHRIDGPVHLYRGKDKDIDDKIMQINKDYATTTVVQSEFTYRALKNTGYNPVNPIIIRNGVNPSIFNRNSKVEFSNNRKIKLISSSWSNNPRKGGAIYAWLDKNLNFNRFEYKFVGRLSEKLSNIEVIEPVPSEKLSFYLKSSDIYITASENDPCSNALIEALACGLPSIYLKSGGHPEIVQFGGMGFDKASEIPEILEKIINNYDHFQFCIKTDNITDIAKKYIECIIE